MTFRPARTTEAKAAVTGLALSLLACASAAPGVAQERESRLLIGVCAHLAQDSDGSAASLDLMAQAGIQSIRDEVYWYWIEREGGQLAMLPKWDRYVDEAVHARIDPLLILDYGNPLYDGGDKPRSDQAIAAFTRYAEFVARRFQGKVRRYEVWNEWDNAGGKTTPGSAADYARLLKTVSPALKKIDPDIEVLADAVIIGDGRDGDFQRMAQLDVLRLVDGISIHPYFYNRGSKKTPEAAVEWLQNIEEQLRRYNNDLAVPLYVTEIGWPTYSGKDGVPLRRSAAYAARLLLLARTMPFLKGLWWYDFRNDGADAGEVGQNFGLLWPDFTPKPAYYAVAAVTKALADAMLIERRATASDDDWILRFRDPRGQELWAIWSAKENAVTRFELATLAENPAPLMIEEVGRQPVTRSWVPAAHGVSRLDVTAGDMPVFLRGALADTTVVGTEHREFPGDLR